MIFRGQIRLHQGSMLNHVLVIIVIERLTREMKLPKRIALRR